jgi:hypothetical protein
VDFFSSFVDLFSVDFFSVDLISVDFFSVDFISWIPCCGDGWISEGTGFGLC